jgi:hypothetical protein
MLYWIRRYIISKFFEYTTTPGPLTKLFGLDRPISVDHYERRGSSIRAAFSDGTTSLFWIDYNSTYTYNTLPMYEV